MTSNVLVPIIIVVVVVLSDCLYCTVLYSMGCLGGWWSQMACDVDVRSGFSFVVFRPKQMGTMAGGIAGATDKRETAVCEWMRGPFATTTTTTTENEKHLARGGSSRLWCAFVCVCGLLSLLLPLLMSMLSDRAIAKLIIPINQHNQPLPKPNQSLLHYTTLHYTAIVKMNMDDVYGRNPSFMTEEELEDVDYDPASETTIHSIPDEMGHLPDLPVPDVFDKDRFLQRKPALGLSLDDIDKIEHHYYHVLTMPVQKRRCEGYLRSYMLRALISPNDCPDVASLCQVLRAEARSGVAAPVPDWFVYSPKRYGPRRTGYRACENRSCLKTETMEKKFFQCSNCRLAVYCTRECQLADWNARHKKLCKKAAKLRAEIDTVSKFLSDFAEEHE